MAHPHQYDGIERRRYIRLKYVFPVEFYFIDQNGNKVSEELIQGFTKDIGEGGICISVNTAKEVLEELVNRKDVKLSLNINIPLTRKPKTAKAAIAWFRKYGESPYGKYYIGASYSEITPSDRKAIVNYARRLRAIPKIIVSCFMLLILFLVGISSHDIYVTKQNRLLIARFNEVIDKKTELEKEAAELDSKRIVLSEELNRMNKDIALLTEQLSSKEAELVVKRLEGSIASLVKERDDLKARLSSISQDKKSLYKNLLDVRKLKTSLEEATVENMYRWLKVHQMLKTGLITSYEGASDLKDWAFTYDQALVVQAFSLFGNYKCARDILDFYKNRAKRIDGGGFANAYDSMTGAVTEYTVHAGPNIWLGISILQYAKLSGDYSYLLLAEDVGDWVISLQNKDSEGGIRGGPKVHWFSTEHNLDAYAFFNMLYEVTNKKEYSKARDKVFAWIKANAYSVAERRMKRGKGDSTIATDTLSWAIASIGPERLLLERMDPDGIIKFAEENCKVTVDFRRPNGGLVKVTGFDFAKLEHIPRGGVISTEWTAQMIAAFKIMSDFYASINDKEKAAYYEDRAAFYMNELEKLVISSPSRSGQGAGCLPYATQANADTGHGWRTPEGEDTGSVAGTAYAIFAKNGHNPLRLSK